MAPVTVQLETTFQTDDHCRLAAVGSIPELGEWNPAQAVPCCNHDDKQIIKLSIEECTDTFEFKWILLDEEWNVVQWQEGANRSVIIPTDVCRLIVHAPWVGDIYINEVKTSSPWYQPSSLFNMLLTSGTTMHWIAIGAFGIACVAAGLSKYL